MKHSLSDTIVAIATPPGQASLGAVRISGEKARVILGRIFGPTEDHRMTHGRLKDPDNGENLDEIMACYMAGPNSFTGEDVVELYCHGGQEILKRVVELAVKEGARGAERGEFTKRAFINGKIDLAQAEAIIDLIKAKTDDGRGLALRQLEGKLSAVVSGIREGLVGLLAEIELQIDFSEDAPKLDKSRIVEKTEAIRNQIERLIATEKVGRLYREGVGVAIVGKPNVGKSSLLNAMLGEERAIVASVPGTTRDTLEESLEIEGLPIRLVDTAGLSNGREMDEAEGKSALRAEQEAEAARYLLVLLDGSEALGEDDRAIMKKRVGRKVITVANKSDLPQKLKHHVDLKISALNRVGIDELKMAIYNMVVADEGAQEIGTVVAINARHRSCLERARTALLGLGDDEEGMSLALKDAVGALGEVTGEIVSEEVLDRIFAEFCVGK